MDRKKRFFYVSMVYPFALITDYGSNVLYRVISQEYIAKSFSETGSDMSIFYNPSVFIVYGCVAVTIRIVSKTNIWSKLQAFGEYPKLYVPMGAFYFLFYVVYSTFASMYVPGFEAVIGMNLAYLALLAVVVLIVGDIKRIENITAAHNLLLHQQNYINKLESIQREIRSIQHDYKNMLVGLYSEAREGNTEAVKEYIETKLLKVDETVRGDLRQIN